MTTKEQPILDARLAQFCAQLLRDYWFKIQKVSPLSPQRIPLTRWQRFKAKIRLFISGACHRITHLFKCDCYE